MCMLCYMCYGVCVYDGVMCYGETEQFAFVRMEMYLGSIAVQVNT